MTHKHFWTVPFCKGQFLNIQPLNVRSPIGTLGGKEGEKKIVMCPAETHRRGGGADGLPSKRTVRLPK